MRMKQLAEYCERKDMRMKQLAEYCERAGIFAEIDGDTMTARLYWHDGFTVNFFETVKLY